MAKKTEVKRPIISGHCAHPQTESPHLSHQRCLGIQQGHPCPCPCHLAHEVDGADSMNLDGTYGEVDIYECGCGGSIAEAPLLGPDEDGDPVYVHVDDRGRMLYTGACR